MSAIKRLLLKTLMLPGTPAFLKHVQRHCATVFMLHRFEDPDRGIEGCDPSHLRRALTYLSRNKYQFVSLTDLMRRLAGDGPEPAGAVAFTIDDGYIDQAAIAAPVFAEFDCPVTTFVSSGFIDGQLWFWWDQIAYVFANCGRTGVQTRLGDQTLAYTWSNDAERDQAQVSFTEACKRVAHSDKVAGILDIARSAEVSIPDVPPPHCAPMSWEQLRSCEGMGMTFGPHTVTHPILARTTDDQARYEIFESWTRLRAEARNPVPVFCYPNGGWEDFGEREIELLRQLGLQGAVVGEIGYASARAFQRTPDGPFRIQRFAFPDEMENLIQYVTGTELFKQMLRST